MKRVLPFIVVGALVFGFVGVADAGAPLPPAQLSVTPNPATTDDAITIGNQAGDANTCEGGEVTYLVMKSDGEGPVAYDTTTPDDNGDWSVTIDPIPVAGTFTVSAECNGELDGAPAGEAPLALPDFVYVDVVLTVTQVEPPTTPSSSTSTTTGTAPATRPSFTG